LRRPDKARAALVRAEHESDEIDRSIWLAKAADYAIRDRGVLVGGVPVNLHTRMYHPTDIDMCAFLDETDRRALEELDFESIQGNHFRYTFEDGQVMLLDFPSTRVDGGVMQVALGDGEPLIVIDRESLVVDRVEQATDCSEVTFDEAVRYSYAVAGRVDWSRVETEIKKRDQANPLIKLAQTYERILTEVRTRQEKASSDS
jgi:hypothetical protein